MRLPDTRTFRNASFKNKLVALTSLVSIVVAIVACAALIATHAMNYKRELAADLSSLASMIGDNSAAALLFDDRVSARETLTLLRATPHIRAGCRSDRRVDRVRAAERATGKRTPIVALTGDRERCFAAGMDGYVTKPIRAAQLLSAIQRLVGKRETVQT